MPIAMGENPGPDAKFEQKGTPDGGVECYWKLTDGREFAWQAKYFNDFDASEWASIKKSLLDAAGTHPDLSKYFYS